MGKTCKYLFSFLAILLGLLVYCLFSLPDFRLHVFVLDIGQGDAILIKTPASQYILIDGGPDDKVLRELSRVMPFYDHTIDLLVLSHPHADHINGLIEVLKRYQVKQVLLTGAAYGYSGYKTFLELINEQKIPILFAGGEKDYRLGSVVLDLLYPFEPIQGRTFENLNNSSIVFRLLYGQRSFYFSGDLEMEKESELVESKLDLRADFLKAGHHGSKTSNTGPLLDRLRPSYAAISCGVDNKFGHPFYLTLLHLQQRNVTIYRTDLDGLIEAVSDGVNLNVKNWGKE
jgi:competence protein ComEC